MNCIQYLLVADLAMVAVSALLIEMLHRRGAAALGLIAVSLGIVVVMSLKKIYEELGRRITWRQQRHEACVLRYDANDF